MYPYRRVHMIFQLTFFYFFVMLCKILCRRRESQINTPTPLCHTQSHNFLYVYIHSTVAARRSHCSPLFIYFSHATDIIQSLPRVSRTKLVVCLSVCRSVGLSIRLNKMSPLAKDKRRNHTRLLTHG